MRSSKHLYYYYYTHAIIIYCTGTRPINHYSSVLDGKREKNNLSYFLNYSQSDLQPTLKRQQRIFRKLSLPNYNSSALSVPSTDLKQYYYCHKREMNEFDPTRLTPYTGGHFRALPTPTSSRIFCRWIYFWSYLYVRIKLSQGFRTNFIQGLWFSLIAFTPAGEASRYNTIFGQLSSWVQECVTELLCIEFVFKETYSDCW